jgi:hypothetical protein
MNMAHRPLSATALTMWQVVEPQDCHFTRDIAFVHAISNLADDLPRHSIESYTSRITIYRGH